MPRNLSLPEFSRGIPSPTTSPKVDEGGQGVPRMCRGPGLGGGFPSCFLGAGLGSSTSRNADYEEMAFVYPI